MRGFRQVFAAFKTCLFMKEAVFEFHITGRAVLASFGIPVISLILSRLTLTVIPPIGTKNIAIAFLYKAAVLETVISYSVYILIVMWFARFLGRSQNLIFHFMVALNWSGLIFLIIGLPVFLSYGYDLIDRQTAENMLIVFLLYGYAVIGFLIWSIYKPPWELAAVMGIVALFCDETTHNLTYRAMNIPLIDYAEYFL